MLKLGSIMLDTIQTVFGTFRKALLAILIVVLVASNILLVASSSFHSLATALIGKLPFDALLKNSPGKRLKKLEADNKELRSKSQRLVKGNARLQRAGLKNLSLRSKNWRLAAERNVRFKNMVVENKGLRNKLVKERENRVSKAFKARQVSRDIAKRTVRNVTANLGSMIAEATPYLGIGVVIASTAMDAKDGCDTMRDINKILNILDETQGLEDLSQVCGVTVPTAEELTRSIKETIGGTLDQSEKNIRKTAKGFYDGVGGTVYYSKERIQKFYNDLGGTMFEIFNGGN